MASSEPPTPSTGRHKAAYSFNKHTLRAYYAQALGTQRRANHITFRLFIYIFQDSNSLFSSV